MVARPRQPVEDTQRDIYAAVVRLTLELARFPTPREVAKATGLSRTTLSRHVDAMEAQGRLRRIYGGRALEALPVARIVNA